MAITTHDKLQALISAGHATEHGFYVNINGTRHRYDGIKFSKMLENKISSLYINMVVPSGTKTPRTIKDKVIYAVHNGAKLEYKTAKNNRKYTLLTIDGKDYKYDLYNVSKRLESKLNRITNTKNFENVQKVKQIYQKHKLNDALKRYAIRNDKADISEKRSVYKSYLNDIVIRNIKIMGLKVYHILIIKKMT